MKLFKEIPVEVITTKYYLNSQEICVEEYYDKVNSGKYIVDYELENEIHIKSDIEHYKQYLRELRNKKCFSIINRGQLWYNSLSKIQIDELQKWYQEWLDVTVTLVKPIKPAWLKETEN